MLTPEYFDSDKRLEKELDKIVTIIDDSLEEHYGLFEDFQYAIINKMYIDSIMEEIAYRYLRKGGWLLFCYRRNKDTIEIKVSVKYLELDDSWKTYSWAKDL